MASSNGHIEIVRLLLGASVNEVHRWPGAHLSGVPRALRATPFHPQAAFASASTFVAVAKQILSRILISVIIVVMYNFQ